MKLQTVTESHFPWTDSGRELLVIINQRIQHEGGREIFAKKILAEQARNRSDRYFPAQYNNERSYKVIVAVKNKRVKRFIGTGIAAEFLGTNVNNLRSCIRLKCNCKGWRVKYVSAYDII